MRPRDRRFDCTFCRLRPRNRRVDCALPPIAPARELRAPHRRVDTGFILKKKIGRNRRYFCCKLPPIAPDGRTDGHFFDFDNYIYRLETPIILPTRSTLRPDPSLRLGQSFARLLRSFSLHPGRCPEPRLNVWLNI